MKRILASFFGVPSNKNRERDFQHGKLSHYLIVGLILTVTFIVAELMNMMPQANGQDKSKAWDQLEGLWAEVVTAAHEVERRLFRGVLLLGYELLGCFSVLWALGMWVPK